MKFYNTSHSGSAIVAEPVPIAFVAIAVRSRGEVCPWAHGGHGGHGDHGDLCPRTPHVTEKGYIIRYVEFL